MTIFTVLKVAKDSNGEAVFATTEKAFKDKAKAEQYVKSVGSLWEEVINNFHCQCERGIHEVEVTE